MTHCNREESMPSNKRWSMHGIEPDLHDVLSDPIVRLVMRRDGLFPGDVWAAIRYARVRLYRLRAPDIETAA